MPSGPRARRQAAARPAVYRPSRAKTTHQSAPSSAREEEASARAATGVQVRWLAAWVTASSFSHLGFAACA
jgi:hypothetical protein